MTHTTQNEEKRKIGKLVGVCNCQCHCDIECFTDHDNSCHCENHKHYEKHNNEGWEGKFSSLFNIVIDGGIRNFLNSHLDVKREYFKSIKKRIEQKPFLEFIRQQRQEASKQGYIQGGDDTLNAFKSAMEREKKQAYDEGYKQYEKELFDKGKFKKLFDLMDRNEKEAQKQAVREYVQYIKQNGSALAIVGDGKCIYSKENHTYGDVFISVGSIEKALEVYEGK